METSQNVNNCQFVKQKSSVIQWKAVEQEQM